MFRMLDVSVCPCMFVKRNQTDTYRRSERTLVFYLFIAELNIAILDKNGSCL